MPPPSPFFFLSFFLSFFSFFLEKCSPACLLQLIDYKTKMKDVESIILFILTSSFLRVWLRYFKYSRMIVFVLLPFYHFAFVHRTQYNYFLFLQQISNTTRNKLFFISCELNSHQFIEFANLFYLSNYHLTILV